MTHALNERWDEITMKLATDRNALLKACQRLVSLVDAGAVVVGAGSGDLGHGAVLQARDAIAQAEQPVSK